MYKHILVPTDGTRLSDKAIRSAAELAAVVGKGAYSRSELVSKLWKYFKKNKLNKGREISADVKLKPVFGKGKITMFEVGGIIGKHLKTKA